MGGWQFQTRMGTVRIVPNDNRWVVLFGDENLGSYHSPSAAADDVAGGHTFTPSTGVDLGSLGIPDDIGEWSKI